MADEVFISGYCRALDGSRTVTAELENDLLAAVDCDLCSCPHQAGCPIAKELASLQA